MLTLAPPASGVWLATRPVDMRKSFDGLSALVEHHCQRNALEGGLFVFVNKRRDRVKLLWWDADGLAIWYKRLEAGTYELPDAGEDQTHVTLTPTRLSLVLGGSSCRACASGSVTPAPWTVPMFAESSSSN